jgi:hypothetical protein
MRKAGKIAILAASLAAFIWATNPLPAMAMGGMGGAKGNSVSCKSGKRTTDVSKCKENGGKL